MNGTLQRLDMTRKDFIHATAGVMMLAGTRLYGEEAPQGRPLVRFGMVTDLHYAALKRVGHRYYRDSLRAMVEGPTPASNSYAEGAIWPSGAFTVTGWRNAQALSIGRLRDVGIVHRKSI